MSYDPESTRDSPYAPPAATSRIELESVLDRRSIMGERLGWASLICALVGMIGTLILPVLLDVLAGVDTLPPNLPHYLRTVMRWTGPGTVIAIVLGAVGYWIYRSQMALYAMLVALAPFLLGLLSLIMIYLFSQID